MSKVRPADELTGIEILRFICALTVVLDHYRFFFVQGLDNSTIMQSLGPKFPLYGVLSPLYERGDLAVPVFWTISGFIFFYNYSDMIAAERVTFQEYLIRRFSRLYPLHIASLLLVATLQLLYLYNHGTYFIFEASAALLPYQIFMGSNWLYWQPFSFNGPIWSVSVEILIYVVFYGIVRTFGCSRTVAAASGTAFGLLTLLMVSSPVPFLNFTVFMCGMFFFSGGVAEKAWRAFRFGKGKWRRRFSSPINAGAAIVAAYVIGIETTSVLILVAAVLGTIALCAQIGIAFAGTVLRQIAKLGNATYSSYLLHFPIQLLAVITIDALGYDRSLFLSLISLCVYLSVVIALSLLVYHRFEVPAQVWLRRLSRSIITSDSKATQSIG